MSAKRPKRPKMDCGAGSAAFCKHHPGVCDGCREASESGEAALWADRRADLYKTLATKGVYR